MVPSPGLVRSRVLGRAWAVWSLGLRGWVSGVSVYLSSNC